VRIAFFTELFTPSRGGQEFRYGRLAKALAEGGHSAAIFTVDHTGGSLPVEETIDGTPVVRYLALRDFVRPGRRSLDGLGRYALATAAEVRRRRDEFDAVVVNQMPLAHLPFLPRDARLAVDWCEYAPGSLAGGLSRWEAGRFDRNLTVDDTVGRRLAAPRARAAWCVVRTPLELARYADGPKAEGRILFVGRLVPHKNVAALAEAVVRLRDRGTVPWTLDVVGDGPLAPALRERFARYSFVRFVGPIDDATKCALLRSAFLVALPSLREGLPNAALEALASGAPIVTCDAPQNALADFVRAHGVGAVARGPGPAAIAAAIAGVDRAAWEGYRARAGALRESLDPTRSARALVSFLQGVST